MSLAEVLTGKEVDKGLDDIFHSSAGPSGIVSSKPVLSIPTPQKRKKEEFPYVKNSKRARVFADEGERVKDTRHERVGKGKDKEVNSDEEDSEEGPDGQHGVKSDGEVPAHEAAKSHRTKRRVKKKAKYVPEGETREERDARTIFVGNLPVAVVKSKPFQKQLKRHITSYVPSAKIESIRFRSVAFRNPTTTLEENETNEIFTRQKRDQKRAADWRVKHDKEAEEVKKDEKKYMTPAEKRRLAAIKGDLHEHDSATTNAYVVFAHPPPPPSDVQDARVPEKSIMDPLEAAREAVLKVNGTIFSEHILRVDLAVRPVDKAQDWSASAGLLTDPRLSIFVGNLDFASSEDDVRAFFEKIMHEERGEPEADEKGEDGGTRISRKSWINRVRIVRDRETQLGKGFAYVQFADRDCVDEVLALGSEKLKFAKRILRVQRCKTLPSAASWSSNSTRPQSSAQLTPPTKTKTHARSATSRTLPKGDPSLGDRLVALPKELRKKAKATDPTRVARRLAKKKARMALEKDKKVGKRVRERKDRRDKSAVNNGKREKKRERSDRNTQRKNQKK